MINDDTKNPEVTLTVNDWLKALKISRNTFKKLLRKGVIPAPLPFGERCQRWSYNDLQDVISRI